MEENSSSILHEFRTFVEEEGSVKEALLCLKKGKEIGLLILDDETALFYDHKGKKPQLEVRSAKEPDVIFILNEASVKKILSQTNVPLSELGIQVVKEIAHKNITVEVPGSYWSLIRNGYLDIIKKGGKDFFTFLTQYGLSNITKIIALIKRMKK